MNLGLAKREMGESTGSPSLREKHLVAYLMMDEDRVEVYKNLREVLMVKFNLSPETYRQRVQQTLTHAGEPPTETYNQLNELYKCCKRPKQCTKEQIEEAIMLEQLLQVLPHEVLTWVREHKPADKLNAEKLATQFLDAHQGGQKWPQATPTQGSKHTDAAEKKGTFSVIHSKKIFVSIASKRFTRLQTVQCTHLN
nr:zinc finger protein 287-like [Danio rerio]|eukprot:XP_021332634.1 zinc finger protein 287-like [Danio rerio]